MNTKPILATATALILFTQPAMAVSSLVDIAINIDGVHSEASPGRVPANFFSSVDTSLPTGAVDDSAYDFATGLGTISVSVSTAGDHFVGMVASLDFFEDPPFFLDRFDVSGNPTAGQSWQIDSDGDTLANLLGSTATGSLLDNTNTNTFPDGSPLGLVEMGLGWEFSLNAMETAEVLFSISDTAPSGFFLIQTDEFTDDPIFFSSSLRIDPAGGASAVPEPGAAVPLFALTILCLFGARRRSPAG